MVYVETNVPSLSPAPIKFQLEQPTASFLETAAREAGTRAVRDTLDVSIRIKAKVSGIPREFAILRASTSDTIAVISTNSWTDNGTLRTSVFSVRAADGSAVTVSVARPYASGTQREILPSLQPVTQRLVTFAARCAERSFSLFAPTKLQAQAPLSECDYAKRKVARADLTMDAVALVAIPTLVHGIFVLGTGSLSATVVGPAAAPLIFQGAGEILGGLTGIVTSGWAAEDAREDMKKACGGGLRPRLYSAPL
jgi:hypothetical protein